MQMRFSYCHLLRVNNAITPTSSSLEAWHKIVDFLSLPGTWLKQFSKLMSPQILSVPSRYRSAARLSLKSAIAFCSKFELCRPLNQNISEDGVVSLEWKSEDYGILINFQPEDEISFSVKSGQLDYGLPTTWPTDGKPTSSVGLMLKTVRE